MQIKNYNGDEIAITIDHSRDAKLTEFGKLTLKDRYLMKSESFQDMFGRVAAYYSDDDVMAQEVYDAISNLWFMPATPVLSNGGTTRGNPISCFLTHVDDSLEGILGTGEENGWLAAKGGGIGTYWGDVRSIGEKVGSEEAGLGETSGIIPFIRMADSQTMAISQGSLRRGSAAVYLDIHHPEIEEFIDIRKPASGGGDVNRKCLNIHHGVNVTDKFMEAVVAGESFDLISPKDGSVRKTVDARNLWMKLLNTRIQTGEPYIVFIDTVNRRRPYIYKKLGLTVKQSNLCSEIALTTGLDHLGKRRSAVCCLSSVNAATVREWFGNKRFLRNVLVFLDNVMTDFIAKTEGVKGFEDARYAAARERSIGLGWMGFATYLQRESIPYESQLAHYENRRIWSWLRQTGDEISREVAEERGACPDAIDAGVMERWVHKFSIAPTASISYIAGEVSPCHDPITANAYTAKTLSGSHVLKNRELDERLTFYENAIFGSMVGEDTTLARKHWRDEVWQSIKDNAGSVQHLPFLTAHDKLVFKTWEELDQRWLVTHMGTRSTDTCGPDQMASNNLFLPPDIDVRDLHAIHKLAWEKGVPSLYYLRSKSVLTAKAQSTAGEIPLAKPQSEVVMRERETTDIKPVASGQMLDYDECLACQ